MRINYVLIDYENVQPKNFALLNREEFRIKVFLGASQLKLSRSLAVALQQFGPIKAEYIEINGSGSNALDFHIAYYIGRISAEEKDAFFHIISKDKGFDPLIAHLKARKIFCQRSASIEDIPLLRTLSAASTPDQADAVIVNLLSRGTSKPRTPKTLSNTISTLFGKKLDEKDVGRILDELRSRKVLSIDGNKVHYALPG
jgi:hypothetical protein